MRSRTLVLGSIASCATMALALACGPDPLLLQGDEYVPDGTLSIGPPTERADAAACQEGGACEDAGSDVEPVPLGDGSTAPLNSCETARAMGTLSGDTGSTSLTAEGRCSEWFSFRATEDDNSALGAGMKVKLTLTPTGADYELYAYLDKERDRLVCDAPTAQSFRPGTATEEIALAWGEGTVANGKDDGRTIGVAVIRASGPCAEDAGSYTLRAEGNR